MIGTSYVRSTIANKLHFIFIDFSNKYDIVILIHNIILQIIINLKNKNIFDNTYDNYKYIKYIMLH